MNGYDAIIMVTVGDHILQCKARPVLHLHFLILFLILFPHDSRPSFLFLSGETFKSFSTNFSVALSRDNKNLTPVIDL